MADILKTAQDAVKARGKDYGDVYINHKRIADQWAVTLGVPVAPEQVAVMMVQLKLARLICVDRFTLHKGEITWQHRC